MDVRVRKTLIVYHFSLHFHKMSLVLTSLHPSSLELRYLVPPCPGRSCLWCVNERVVVVASVRVARLCVLSPVRWCRGCSAVWSREKTLLLILSDSHVFKGEQGSPTQLQENAPVFPISWAKTCPPRKILTDHRCIKSCRRMPRQYNMLFF